jgi:glycosyltransferase involved in cell wall biosynthesis
MNKKIKILFAINCMNIGGAPTVVFEQIKNLDKEKFDPYLLTLYPSKKANYFSLLKAFLPEEKIKQFNLKNRSLFDFGTLFQIYKFLKQEKFKIVYTHLFLANLLVRFLAIIARTPKIIIFEHSLYTEKRKWQIICDYLLSYYTDKIVVSIEAAADFTSKQENINLKKFVVIANQVVLPKNDKDILAGLKNQYNLNGDFTVMSLGRFSREKGQIYFVEAAEKILKNNKSINFILVGHGPMEGVLFDEIKKRGIENNFKLIIEPQKAKYFYYLADIFVLSSLREGQSIVTHEAMLAGLPVVASRLESLEEIIKDGVNGLFFEKADAEELAEKILEIKNDIDLKKKLSENVSQTALNFENIKLNNVFEELLLSLN